MPGRSASLYDYRYAFNGKEKDDEVKGDGVQYDYGFRIYDSRMARFLSVDPLTSSYPWYTPYQFAGNMPIRFVDIDGLEQGDLMHQMPTIPGLFVSTVRGIANGLYNTAIAINEKVAFSDEEIANRIRIMLVDKYNQTYFDAFSISTEQILNNFEIRFDFNSDGYYLDTKDGAVVESLEVLGNGLDILSAFGLKGDGLISAKSPSRVSHEVGDIVDGIIKNTKKLLGADGAQFHSITVWKKKGSKARLDVENPNPGQRAGNIHYQDENNIKYLFDVEKNKFFGKNKETGEFDIEVPKVDDLLKDETFNKAIDKALKYLGESE